VKIRDTLHRLVWLLKLIIV